MPINIKGCFFDMFGTILNWRPSVAREAQAILRPLGYELDWLAFADAWRAGYRPAMDANNDRDESFLKLDVLHRQILEEILPRSGVRGLDDATVHDLNLAWHRLDAWPDVTSGMRRLRERYLLAPLSNGNVSLIADVARRNDIHFDAILGAEYAQRYKREPAVYERSMAAFDLDPAESLMCAAHIVDLRAAASVGMRTAFIHRPDEYGPDSGEPIPDEPVDLIVHSVEELASKLGV